MILIVATILSTLIALLRGGRLTRLADLRLQSAWLVLAAVILQYPLVYDILPGATLLGVPLSSLVMIASYLMLAWVVWINRRLPGIPLIGLGLLSNLIVMVANGGWMPITPEAVERLGHRPRVAPSGPTAKLWGAKDVMLPRAATRFWLLSDVFVLAPPFPVPAAFSIGDVLVASGIFWLLQEVLVGAKDSSLASESALTGREMRS